MESLRDIPVSASVLIASLAASWLLYTIVATYLQYRKLRHIKGPFIASFTPFWLFYHTVRGDLYLAIADASRKYGSLVRIAPNVVVTDDPVSQRFMTSSKSAFIRGHWFKGMKFDPRVDNVLSEVNEERHAAIRKQLIPGYTGKEVPTLERDVNDRLVEFIAFIQRYVEKSETFCFSRAVSFYTLDILTQIAFGEKLGFMAKNEDIFQYIKSSQDFFPLMELGSNHPTIYNIMKSPLMAGAQPKPTDRFGFGAIIGHTQKVVAARFQPGAKDGNDMLASFVRHGMKQEECESESILQILAGADSTATALRSTFCHIMTSPYVYSKLVAEIKGAISSGKASRPVIKQSEAQALPYLQAVIKEGLRVFMPLNGIATRLPPKQGIELKGMNEDVWIPGGTEVGSSTYSMLRRKDIFGHDADTFRPERWIDGDAANIKNMSNEHELIFGSGRSSCLGRGIAFMELSKTIFEVLNVFDLVIVNSFNPMTIKSNSVVVQKNFFVRAYSRSS